MSATEHATEPLGVTWPVEQIRVGQRHRLDLGDLSELADSIRLLGLLHPVVAATGTLRRVYARSDAATLARSLRIIRDAYGDPGLEAPVIDGIGLLCQRYNGELTEDTAVERLGKANGGVNGLLNAAELLRRKTGNQKGHCVAAAAVDIINTGRGGKKLPSWWKDPA